MQLFPLSYELRNEYFARRTFLQIELILTVQQDAKRKIFCRSRTVKSTYIQRITERT